MPQPGSTPDIAPASFTTLLDRVRERVDSAGKFGECAVLDDCLECKADGSAEDAWYRVQWGGGRVWVSLEMADRWQSESIEAELVHTGDKLDELLEEEMVELGYEGPRPTFEHYRSDDMLFVFRTPVSVSADAMSDMKAVDDVVVVLLGYEACFRQLGDMDAENEED